MNELHYVHDGQCIESHESACAPDEGDYAIVDHDTYQVIGVLWRAYSHQSDIEVYLEKVDTDEVLEAL